VIEELLALLVVVFGVFVERKLFIFCAVDCPDSALLDEGARELVVLGMELSAVGLFIPMSLAAL